MGEATLPRMPLMGEVKRRSEPPIGGRVKSPRSGRVRMSNGFRQSLPAAGLGGESSGQSPNAAGVTGFHRRRGFCGEARPRTKKNEAYGGPRLFARAGGRRPSRGGGASRFQEAP